VFARILVAGFLALLASSRSLPAQTPPPAQCTYDSCGLRLEPGFFGASIKRGVQGQTAAKIGLFNSNIERIVQGSDSATRFARSFRAQHTTAATLGIIAGAVALVSVFQIDPWDDGGSNDGDNDLATAGLIGSSVLGLVGAAVEISAQRALSRAIWWYNRDLPR
jgi:hypothetical protein